MVSQDKTHFFEFDEQKTNIYRIKPYGLEQQATIAGKLLGVTIDSRYLLLRKQSSLQIFELSTLKEVATTGHAYNTESDLLVFDPSTGIYILKNSIEIEDYKPWAPGFVYRSDFAQLQHTDPKAYVFSIYGQGIPYKYLLYGKMRNENGQQILVFPRRYSFTANGECGLFVGEFLDAHNHIHGITPDDCAKQTDEELSLCDFSASKKIVFPRESSIKSAAISSDGSIGVFSGGSDIVIHRFQDNWRFCINAGDFNRIVVDLAISPDGKHVIMICDNEMSWVTDEIGGISYTVVLCSTFTERIVELLSCHDIIRHVGFIDNSHFFLSTDKQVLIYAIDDFALAKDHGDAYPVFERLGALEECVYLLKHPYLVNHSTTRKLEDLPAFIRYLCESLHQIFDIDIFFGYPQLKQHVMQKYLTKHPSDYCKKRACSETKPSIDNSTRKADRCTIL